MTVDMSTDEHEGGDEDSVIGDDDEVGDGASELEPAASIFGVSSAAAAAAAVRPKAGRKKWPAGECCG